MRKYDDQVISVEELEKRYKTVRIRVEDTRTWNDKPDKRYVVDCIHDGSIYYVHIEFSSFGTMYSGDMGEFMFEHGYRESLFKGNHINPGYWEQKVDAANRGYFEKEIKSSEIDKSYKDYVLAQLEGDLAEEYYQSAKEALELSDDDFEKWREETIEKNEDDEEFVDDIQKIRDAGKPSDYMERNSYESAYDAVDECGKEAGIDIDFESVDSIVSDGIEENYRFLYACCVLQWVANKIYGQFKKDVNNG